ncbi:MAG: hypothetical protein QNJ84_04375 [Alphaproteobacteria bacterium]|nr:hypothetical protein [Alphaproteobacteria bacterium]
MKNARPMSRNGGTMIKRGARIALGGVAIAALSACEALWPSVEAPDPVAPEDRAVAQSSSSPAPAPAVQTRQTQSAPAAPAASAPAPRQAVASVATDTPAVGQTFVGRKVDEMQSDLSRLQAGVTDIQTRANQIMVQSQDAAARYHSLVAAVTSRLQQGTTPGNPVLVAQWNQAQTALENIAEVTPQVTTLSNDAAEQAAFGQYLLNAVQATYGLSGAVEDDHVRLRALEDNVHQSVVLVDRTLNELSQDISRQNAYVNNERQNMTTLSLAIKNGELYGSSLATQAFTQTENIARAAARAATPAPGDRPLVIIRFDRPNVQYQQALFNAVSQALSRKPTATFSILAVSPNAGNAAQVALNSAAAKRNAEDVLRSLTDMGVPSSRVQLLSATDQVDNNEVQVFVR